MASNGLLNRAKTGTCRICQRVGKTDKKVKSVGEVSHGMATGHIWECIDFEDCKKVAESKLMKHDAGTAIHEKIKVALSIGQFSEYMYVV